MRGYGTGKKEREREGKEKTQWKLTTIIKQRKHYKEKIGAETIEKT